MPSSIAAAEPLRVMHVGRGGDALCVPVGNATAQTRNRVSKTVLAKKIKTLWAKFAACPMPTGLCRFFGIA